MKASKESVWNEKAEPGIKAPVPTFRGSERTNSQRKTRKQQHERTEGKRGM